MNMQIINKPAFAVVGMKIHTSPQEGDFPGLWRRFGPRMHEIQHVVAPETSYGLSTNWDETTGKFDYIAAMQVDSTEDLPEGMVSLQIPAQTYAVFPAKLSTISETYDQIHSQWLSAAGRRRASGPDFEYYDEQFNPDDPESEFHLYVPIGAA